MFPSEEKRQKAAKKRALPFELPFDLPLNFRLPDKKWMLIGGGGALLLLVIGIIVLVQAGSSVTISDSVRQKVKSSIYLPSKLPGTYKIKDDSFQYVDQDSVLIFQATDKTNSKLIFSEQAKPKDFDFDNFYKGQFENAETLSGVPYPSVWGKSMDGRVVLSVVTDDTWIMVVTSAPLGQGDMARIASSVQKQ